MFCSIQYFYEIKPICYFRFSSSGGWKTKSRRDEERNKYIEEEKQKKKESSSSSSSSESEEEEEKKKVEDEKGEEIVKPKILTESELNALSAKMVKAEIMGNNELVNELKTKINDAREARSNFIAQAVLWLQIYINQLTGSRDGLICLLQALLC